MRICHFRDWENFGGCLRLVGSWDVLGCVRSGTNIGAGICVCLKDGRLGGFH